MSKKIKKKLQKKLQKKEKKTKLKTKEFRLQEIQKVKNQLTNIGFSDVNPDIVDAFKIFDDYIEYGTAFTGKIKINGFQRVLNIILSNRSHITSTICLEFNKEV